MLYTELLEKVKERLHSDPNVNNSELRQTIIDLIPADVFEMIDIAASGDVYQEVEAYGVSIQQVCQWAIIEQIEQDYPFPEDFEFQVGDVVRATVHMTILNDDFAWVYIEPGAVGEVVEVLPEEDFQPYRVKWYRNCSNQVDGEEIERI